MPLRRTTLAPGVVIHQGRSIQDPTLPDIHPNLDEWNDKVGRAASNRQDAALAVSLRKLRALEAAEAIDDLPPRLRQVARLRLDNPDVGDLRALARLADPPITRDTLQNSLTKLHAAAARLADAA